jgi:hypothetical protein
LAKIPQFKSINDARNYRAGLLEKLERIELQLGSKSPDDTNEYITWRNKAVTAKKHTLAEMRMTKDWIRREEERLRDAMLATVGVVASDPLSLLTGGARLLTKLQREGVEFDEDERALIYAIRDRVRETLGAEEV